MASDSLPSEAPDTLRDLWENGSAVMVSAAVLEFLISSGCVEMRGGTPVVTSVGLDPLGSDGTPIPPLPPIISHKLLIFNHNANCEIFSTLTTTPTGAAICPECW